MKTVQFNLNIPKYLLIKIFGRFFKKLCFSRLSCLAYRDVKEPELLDGKWMKIKTKLSGICGSDLSSIFGKGSLSLEPFVSFPFIYGHENYGIVKEMGSAVEGFKVGNRVVVEPILACRQREISPLCEHCAKGEFNRCKNLTEGVFAPGLYAEGMH